MPERGPTSPYLALCEVCGAEVWLSHRTHKASAQHLRSRRHLAAVARRKRERATPERLDLVRVLVRLEVASMPTGSHTGEHSYAWRSLPRAAVDALSTALSQTLDRFAPTTVGKRTGFELWRAWPDSPRNAARAEPAAGDEEQLALDLTPALKAKKQKRRQ